MDIDVKNLHPLEVRLLRHVKIEEAITADRLIAELDYKVGQCNQAFSWLVAKGYLEEVSRKKRVFYELTDFGREQQLSGTPAFCIFTYLQSNGAATLPELAKALGLEKKDVGSAFGALSKAKVTKMNEEHKAIVISDKLPESETLVAALLKKGLDGSFEDVTLNDEEKKAIKN